jgi:flagellar biosynthesis protein FlhF
MKTKQYRAATMREALEKVKGELGDEALVLSSKHIRHAGFLGIGAKNLVEVTVSADLTDLGLIETVGESTPRKSTFTSLGLNSSAGPEHLPSSEPERTTPSVSSALAARAYSAEAGSLSANPPFTRGSTAILFDRPASRDANAGDTTTKVLPQETTYSSAELEGANPITVTKRDPILVELDRLRAEMREMKFTLGTAAGLQRDTTDVQSHSDLNDADARIYDSPFYETYLHLGALGLPPFLAKAVTRAVLETAPDGRDIQELTQIGLIEALPSLVTFAADPLATPTVAESGQPVVALIGPTGVGKTTTIAKLAARTVLREGRRVELITLDTYRIAAIEQLKTYAEIIGAGFHVPRSILELDVLIKRFSGEATIMIDTIGRSARDLADQLELADYLRNNEQIIKCLVIQASTNAADAQVAISKFALFGINRLVITKVDETCRSGASVAMAAAAGVPLAYLCNGQRVPEDIEIATATSLAACVLRPNALALAA